MSKGPGYCKGHDTTCCAMTSRLRLATAAADCAAEGFEQLLNVFQLFDNGYEHVMGLVLLV